jgi:hypothetical protein
MGKGGGVLANTPKSDSKMLQDLKRKRYLDAVRRRLFDSSALRR